MTQPLLLRVAKLDLQTKIHGISDEELRALCDALAGLRPMRHDGSVIDLITRMGRK